jgi:hypothetical protein
MSIGHDIHPLAIRVRNDAEYFNRPCGVACNHCLRPITRSAPVPCPIMMQPLSHATNEVQVFRVHKNFCTKHCLAGTVEQQEQNPMVMRNMLVEVGGTLVVTRFPLSPRKSIIGCSSSPDTSDQSEREREHKPVGSRIPAIGSWEEKGREGLKEGERGASASDTPEGRISA